MAGSERPDAATAFRSGTQWIVLRLGDADYVIRSAEIAHVEMVVSVTPVPNAPAFVRGIVSLRGEVVPVVDLRLRLGLPSRAVDNSSRLVVVDVGGRRIGLLVDAAREVIYLDEADVTPPPEATGEHTNVSGVVRRGDRLLLVLDVASVLSVAGKRSPVGDRESPEGERE